MGSPPPPPAHHGYGRASPRDLHSPFSENSGRYSDNYGPYSDIHFTDRPVSRAPSSRTTSSSNSNSNKSYLYYQFQRGEESWTNCRRYEISASQDEIKRKAKGKSKSGNVIDQLERMGKPRLDQIESLKAELDSSEADGSSWEIIFIENTKTKPRGNTLKVTEFNIVFRRRGPKPEASRRQSKAAEKPYVQEVPAQAPIFAPQPKAGGNKGAKVSIKDEYLHTPFNDKPLFSHNGQPLDANGPMPFATSMPGNIRPERPMAQMLPKIHTQSTSAAAAAAATAKKPQARALPGDPLDLDALLGDTHAGDPDGIINVGEEHQPRPGPGPRRQSSAQRSNNGGRYSHVNIETRHPEFYTSNRSSWASEEGSVMYGELDELSSRTSDETHSSHRSPARKTYRTFAHARHSSGQHSPGSPRYRGGDALVVPERTRRPTGAETQRPLFGAVEQISPKRSASKPMVVQAMPPRPSAAQPTSAVPPTAEYPSYYADQDREHDVNSYIREAQREQEKMRAREAEIAQREREVDKERRDFEDKKHPAPKPVEVTAGGRRRYTYEPRDIYGH